jgi:hypothetical protein
MPAKKQKLMKPTERKFEGKDQERLDELNEDLQQIRELRDRLKRENPEARGWGLMVERKINSIIREIAELEILRIEADNNG